MSSGSASATHQSGQAPERTRTSADRCEHVGFDASHGAPPSALGAVVAWLATAREAAALGGSTVHGQELCLQRGLHEDWRRTTEVTA